MKTNFKNIIASGATLVLVFASVAVLPASAEVAANVGVTSSTSVATPNVSGSTNTTVSVKTQTKDQAKVTALITKSDASVAARITALNNLNDRISAMQNLGPTLKSNILATVNTNVSGLSTLKAKIDADTDLSLLTTDSKSILGSFRIYALVIPQGYIIASADRVGVIADMMTTLSGKLQTRISTDQAAGRNVTALQASLTDMNTKIADARGQASIALSGVATLTPDQGDKTKMAANTAALKAARAKIKISTSDLEAARKDAKSIVQGLKVNSKTTTTTSTTVTQ